ncbi:MAG: RsmD family RNA methyltransferase [Candidatus Saccharibacteria bacterium]|nr:RsmD family RNA methyltransferase [Candidatus Saccharibacteria bacterium]
MRREKKERLIRETIRIGKIIPGGMGLGENMAGKKVMLFNTLPGEVVAEFLVTKEKTHYIEGVATEFLEKAEERVMPQDECYLSTSPFQMMNYRTELSLKEEMIRELFRKIETPEILPLKTDGNEFYYRNKMEYSFWYDIETGQNSLAFHRRGSHQKIIVEKSSIERKEIFVRAQEILAEMNARGEDSRKYQSLMLRCNQNGEISGGIFEKRKSHPDFSKLSDTILGRRFYYSANGFFQVNLPVYEMALLEISQYIGEEEVLDLYAGVGTIGLSVAKNKVKLVEVDKNAYAEMVENVAEFSGAEAVLARAEEVTDFVRMEQTVILDPPRAGCDEKLIARLNEVVPGRIIYLSCNPATQVRDIERLLAKYKIVKIQPFNFFPKTVHIENLVVLERR